MYWRRILLANCSKSRKSCRLIMILLVTGVGINLRTLDSTLTWSSDSDSPMVNMTQTKVNQIIDKLHRGKYIDDMTKKWLAITPSPPRIPVFYTLTKEIHKGIHPRLQNSPTSRRKPFNRPFLPRATLRG